MTTTETVAGTTVDPRVAGWAKVRGLLDDGLPQPITVTVGRDAPYITLHFEGPGALADARLWAGAMGVTAYSVRTPTAHGSLISTFYGSCQQFGLSMFAHEDPAVVAAERASEDVQLYDASVEDETPPLEHGDAGYETTDGHSTYQCLCGQMFSGPDEWAGSQLGRHLQAFAPSGPASFAEVFVGVEQIDDEIARRSADEEVEAPAITGLLHAVGIEGTAYVRRPTAAPSAEAGIVDESAVTS